MFKGADSALLLLHSDSGKARCMKGRGRHCSALGGDGSGIIGGGGSDGDVGGILMVFQVGKARCARDEADRAGLLLHIQAARGFQFANCLRL